MHTQYAIMHALYIIMQTYQHARTKCQAHTTCMHTQYTNIQYVRATCRYA